MSARLYFCVSETDGGTTVVLRWPVSCTLTARHRVGALGPHRPCFGTDWIGHMHVSVYRRMEAYGLAILDAEKAIALDPTYTKGYAQQ